MIGPEPKRKPIPAVLRREVFALYPVVYVSTYFFKKEVHELYRIGGETNLTSVSLQVRLDGRSARIECGVEEALSWFRTQASARVVSAVRQFRAGLSVVTATGQTDAEKRFLRITPEGSGGWGYVVVKR